MAGRKPARMGRQDGMAATGCKQWAHRMGVAGLMVLPFMLGACDSRPMPKAPTKTDLTREIVRPRNPGPPENPPGACWEADITPAVIETVTEQVMVTPEKRDDAGNITAPASYRTDTSQRIAHEREVVYFRTPCPAEQTMDFVATLQRALLARGYYDGPLTGTYDATTAEAIRRFQAERGLDSPRISLGAARELGIATVPLEDLE